MGHMIYKVDLNQHGEVSEWFKVTVLKTVEVNSSVGSNPTLSATFIAARWARPYQIWRSTQEAEEDGLLNR